MYLGSCKNNNIKFCVHMFIQLVIHTNKVTILIYSMYGKRVPRIHNIAIELVSCYNIIGAKITITAPEF